MKIFGASKTAGNARVRILIPVILALVALAVVFSSGIYALRERQMSGLMTEASHAVGELERQHLERSARLMSAVAGRIAAAPDLRAAFVERDKARLERLLTPVWDSSGDDFGVIRLALRLPDRQALVDLRRDAIGGVETDLDAFGARFADGVEGRYVLDSSGALFVEVTIPWRVDGRLIGYIDLARSLDGMAEAIKRATNCEVLVLVRKDQFDHANWSRAERRRGRDDGWDRLQSSVAVAQTLKTIPTSLGLMLEEGGRPRRAVVGSDSGRHVYHIAWLPLADKDGNALGSVVVLHDVTASADSFQQIVLVVTAACLVFAVVLFFVLTAALEDVDRRERKSQEIAERLDAFSKGEGRRRFDLRDLPGELTGRFGDMLAGSALRLDLPDQPAWVDADPTLLRDALHQLVLNAVEAAPETTVVLGVAAERRDEADGWALIVEDDGPGVPREMEADIFAFLATRKGGGFGLPLVRHIADLIGARLDVRNRPQGGARVALWLPRVERPQPNA